MTARSYASEPARVALDIPVTLYPRGAEPGVVWPVTFGVPFPQGTLSDKDSLRLLAADGSGIPLQSRVTARWPDRSIQWVLLDTQLPAAAHPVTYRVRREPATAPAPAVENPIQISRRNHAVFVETGPLVLRIPTDRLIPLSGVRGRDTDGKWVSFFGSDRYAELYLEDAEGTAYLGSLEETPEVVVEEEGPLRAVVRLEGWMRAEDGRKLGRRIVRISAFAGSRSVQVFDTFVNTADTRKTQFRNISLHLPFQGRTGHFPGAAEKPEFAFTDGAFLLQYENDAYEVVADGVSVADGTRAPGRASVSLGDTAYSVVWRHFWQMHPNEMEIVPGSLRLHFWPRHGKPAAYRNDPSQITPDNLGHLRWVHEGELLDFSTPAGVHAYEPPGYPRSYFYNDLNQLLHNDNALGIARTSEYWLHFHGTRTEDPFILQADAFERPPLALADPQWLADSGAFWQIAPAQAEYAEIEEPVARTIEFFDRMQETLGRFGKWTFGMYSQDYKPHFEAAWPHRQAKGFHQGGPRWKWLTLVRTGDPRYFDFAESHSRHLMDVAVVNWEDQAFNLEYWREADSPVPFVRFWATHDSGPRKYRGAMAHCQILVPWGFGNHISFDGTVDWALWYYFLTGYRRAYDTALTMGEFILRQESLLRLEHGMPREGFPEHQLFPSPEIERKFFETPSVRGMMDALLTTGREGTGVGATALQLYRATNDRRYFEVADRIMKARMDPATRTITTKDNFAPLMTRYWETTRDPSLAPYVKDFADTFLGGGLWAARAWYDILALAYEFTGDASYLQAALTQAYYAIVPNTFHGIDPLLDGTAYTRGLPSSAGYTGQQWGHVVRALNLHERRTGERLSLPSPLRPYPWQPAGMGFGSVAGEDGRHRTVFHLRKEAGRAVDITWPLTTSAPAVTIAVRPPGADAAGVADDVAVEDGKARARVALPASAPAGEYEVTLEAAAALSFSWPYEGAYDRVVVEEPVSLPLHVPLRVFTPAAGVDRMEIFFPPRTSEAWGALSTHGLATHQIFRPDGRRVFAQTYHERPNFAGRYTIPVSRADAGRPWFYLRSNHNTNQIEWTGRAPVWAFTAEEFFLPEKWSRPSAAE